MSFLPLCHTLELITLSRAHKWGKYFSPEWLRWGTWLSPRHLIFHPAQASDSSSLIPSVPFHPLSSGFWPFPRVLGLTLSCYCFFSSSSCCFLTRAHSLLGQHWLSTPPLFNKWEELFNKRAVFKKKIQQQKIPSPTFKHRNSLEKKHTEKITHGTIYCLIPQCFVSNLCLCK